MKRWLAKLFPGTPAPPTAAAPIPASVQPFLRTCWKPVTGARPAAPEGSKFCGVALIPRGESWPPCGNCSQPLRLFVQLRSTDLPSGAAGAFGEGILQLFYCNSSEPSCEVDAEAWVPFSKATLARVLPASTVGSAGPPDAPKNALPERAISGWEPLSDLPNWEELATLGAGLDDAESERLSEKGFPRSGDKLLGWPAWVQGVEYPACPTCSSTMKYVMQVDSEDNVPYMFGDLGCGHVFQCAQHPDALGFGWACS